MITLADCGSWQECQLLKSKLESAGIPVFVPDEMSNLDGLIMHFGGFRIQVAEEDAAAAAQQAQAAYDKCQSEGLICDTQTIGGCL